MKTIYLRKLNILILLVFTLHSCLGNPNKNTQEELFNTNVVDKQNNIIIWKQIDIGNPFDLEITHEFMQKLKEITVNIANDTVIINSEYSAKFKIEQKTTSLFFSHYEGIGDFIIEYLSKLNINIKSNVTVFNFSSYSNNTIPTDYLIANSIVCVENYLFVVYKQNYVLVYKKQTI